MSEITIGNIKNVVINKNELLSILKENRAKHDTIFDVAISGYWIQAQNTIDKKKQEFKNYIKELGHDFNYEIKKIANKINSKERINQTSIGISTNMNYQIGLPYPENHSDEYNRAIRAVELNVYDKIELSEQEFNQYIMNNWAWRNSFINSNSNYVNLSVYSGYCGTGYYSNGLSLSGCSIF